MGGREDHSPCVESHHTTRACTKTCCGDVVGNVDIFDASGPKLSKEPAHNIDNLTTAVSSLQFHHEGELLVAASQSKKNQFRLIHTGAASVFPNWPTQQSPLQR